MTWIVGICVFLMVTALARSAYAKGGTTLYTPEEIANARENVARYDWARAEMEQAVKACEPWMRRSDEALWNLVTGQEVPRGIHVNPELGCPSCGREVYRFGNYPWKVSLDRPYKLECPSCGEVWPKNDFGAFHDSGLGDGGVFRRKLADEALLFNAEHPDAGDPKRTFAVDDGQGWVDEQGRRWWFVAYYSHYCTWQELTRAVSVLGQAYLFTGDAAYAHKGALLLDRIADVYPEMDLMPYSKMELYNSHGSTGRGRIVGCIWETGKAKTLARAYDMVYEGMADDAELVRFLSGKARQWKLGNDKSSVARIRENIENQLLREFIVSCRDGRISGNEGMTQSAMATAAVVLDDPVDSPPALDWCFEPGRRGGQGGGHIPAVLIGEVDRDGVGNEASPSYSFGWMNNFRQCAEVLAAGKKYRDYDLYRDFPRFKKMHRTPYLLTALDTYTPRIGDTGKTGDPGMVSVNLETAVDAFNRFGEPYFAQLAYKLNGNSAAGLRTSIYDKDPEAIQARVQAVIDRYGELDLGSQNLNGYGLAVFRTGGGEDRRAAWLYYGRNSGHGHLDRLNYGMYYRGMDVLPDLGYPEYADGKWPKRAGWTRNTISHNTVQVNRRAQETNWIGRCQFYEASGDVGVIEVASPEVYPETKDYRRTFAMVDISKTESYLVDVFRVAGGEDHVLSFHAGEGEAEAHGAVFIPQAEGTYAGADIAFGAHFDGPPDGRYRASGYAYLYGVSRAKQTRPGWHVDWKIVDTWGTRIGDAPVHVRFHALSPAGESALAWGDPPQNKPGNPRRLRYLVQRNQGRDLRSLFASVVAPYSGDAPNLKSVARIDLGLSANDLTAAAVRVETRTGRVDVVLSSDDPGRLFDLGQGISVAARFAVVSVQGGQPVQAFLLGAHRAVLPGGELAVDRAVFSGKVKGFHREEVGPAWIDVEGDLPQGAQLRGAQLRIHNDGVRDAVYEIQGVSGQRIDLGDVTFIRGLASDRDYGAGYVYDVAPGNAFDIQTLVHVRFREGQAETIRATSGFAWKNR